MDDFENEIKVEFINEALINLEEAEGSFMELESSSQPKPLLDKIFRLAHNLKGGSRAVGFGDVAEFTHQLENLVQKIQRDEVQLSAEVITTLLRSNDRLVEMLAALKADPSASFDSSDLLGEIEQRIAGGGVGTVQPSPSLLPSENKVEVNIDSLPVDAIETNILAPLASEFEDSPLSQGLQSNEEMQIIDQEQTAPSVTQVVDREQDVLQPESPKTEPQKNTSKDISKAKTADHREDEIIRVNLSKIDMLNDYVGELIVLQSMISQQAGQVGGPLQGSIRTMIKLSKDIQSISMSLRMLPVKPLVQKLQRVVRDTAQTLSKDVLFSIEGDQLEVDKSVLDRLADPLIHMLRNAVDHGLETAEERIVTDKPKQGKVKLAFLNEGNHLIVEVSDDGKGINGDILRKKAIEKGIISESQVLTEKQLVHLIFHPGFSTKSSTSEISGRGVGMDVVKTNVEKSGGQIDLSTTVGKGSIFRIQIPLSLAVIEGLIVQSEKNRFVVPLSQVRETINLKTQKVFTSKLGIGSCFELRQDVVPLIELEDAICGKRGQSSKELNEGTALMINVKEQIIGLVVQDILRAQQIVIKPLGNGIANQQGWIGSCVLGDGLPALILSPVDLLSGKIRQNILSKDLVKTA